MGSTVQSITHKIDAKLAKEIAKTKKDTIKPAVNFTFVRKKENDNFLKKLINKPVKKKLKLEKQNAQQYTKQLLEKTEELYLHVIEQDKQLDAKNNEIQELKASSKAMNERLEKLERLISEKDNQ